MSVLVTGATGFIGREIVGRLLAAGRHVVALARGRDGMTARDRVAAAVAEGRAAGYLDVVEGNLAAPDCGLHPKSWRLLRTTVTTVINCGGDTRFEPDTPLPYLAGHVHGPVRLMEGLAGGRLTHWAQLSTAFVCGQRSGTILEREGDVGQRFHNSYERVKLEAERVLRIAGGELGVDVRTFRPSIVVGAAPATAGGAPSNLFFGFIRMLAALAASHGRPGALRVAAAPRAPFNIVPVEYVATAVVTLAEQACGVRTTCHLVVRHAAAQAEVLRTLTDRLGVRGVSLLDAREPLAHPSALERAVARRLEPYRAYLTQDVRFDDATAVELLAHHGLEPPTLSTALVHRLVDHAAGRHGRAPRRRPVGIA